MKSRLIDTAAVFCRCTAEQKATLELVADGRTTDEIATHFDISSSAATKRVQTLRRKLGDVTKAEVGRLYREYCLTEEPCRKTTATKNQLPFLQEFDERFAQNFRRETFELSDAVPFAAPSAWASREEPRVVPEVLEGANASIFRLAASVGLAVGLLVLALILLAVAGGVGELI